MKRLILVSVMALSLNANADVFSDYQAVGQEALALAQDPATPTDDFVAKIQELVGLGYQIMDLYVVKHTECIEQFEQVKAADVTIQTLTYDEIDNLYHDGKGLVAAPNICYRGRSMIVHPYQMAALAREGELQNQAETVDHELNEVIGRADWIKQDLGL
jgi:hypothetical protein